MPSPEKIKRVKRRVIPHTNDHDALAEKTEQLRFSEELYRHMIDEVRDYAIFSLDTDGNIQTWNKGAEKIKGYTEEEILCKNFRIFYPLEEQEMHQPEKLLQKASKEGRATHEGWRVRKDGSKFWGNVTITALHDTKHHVVGFTKITRDMTKEKQDEDKITNLAAELEARNKILEEKNVTLQSANAELSSFNFIVSHYLQEPSRKIQMLISKMFNDGASSLPDEEKSKLRRIRDAASRMQQLVIDFITYSQSSTSNKKFEPTDLNQIVHETWNELRVLVQEHHAIIEYHDLPNVRAVPYQMRQLFSNLLSNAVKFSAPDRIPIVQIDSSLIKGNEIEGALPQDKKQNFYKIAVSDNGIGFEPKYKERIFELFERLHSRDAYPGTGLGLAICKKIVENHDGYMAAESAGNGKGSVFIVYLPGMA